MENAKRWLVANWKMHGNAQSVREYVEEISPTVDAAAEGLTCVYCPPAPYLRTAFLAVRGRLALGAQDCHEQACGAHTGSVSAEMLKDCGATFVIVGHSERRQAGETDKAVLLKAKAVISSGLMPIICVGESHVAYTENKTVEVLNQQLASLKVLAAGTYLIAYEPIWAIGTGATPTGAEISAAHSHIKTVLGSETAVLYGGSVNAGNAQEILGLAEVSGALVGGASLQVPSMRNIILAASGQSGN